MIPFSTQMAVSLITSRAFRGLTVLAFVGCSVPITSWLAPWGSRFRATASTSSLVGAAAFLPHLARRARRASLRSPVTSTMPRKTEAKPSFSASSVNPCTWRISFPWVVDLFASRWSDDPNAETSPKLRQLVTWGSAVPPWAKTASMQICPVLARGAKHG